MKKLLPLIVMVVLFSSHDMYLKLDTYFLEAGTEATIKLFNGTFDKSENVIDRNRMIDASLVGNGERIRVDTTQWSERENMTLLSFKTGEAGTWVAGLSTKPRNIEMDAEAFNRYLEHDGVLDMLKWREKNNAMGDSAIERYSKHVKTIFQVGEKKSDDWNVALGYPIEFIPLANPYDLQPGDEFSVKLLFGGEPLVGQLVTIDAEKPKGSHSHDHGHAGAADHDHDHDAADGHSHASGTQLRTNIRGEVTFPVGHEGVWYLRTIHLVTVDLPGLTHESNWATLTFEVGHGHAHAAHDHGEAGHHHHADGSGHSHSHGAEAEFPAYLFWIGSIAVLGGLFFFFNRKS